MVHAWLGRQEDAAMVDDEHIVMERQLTHAEILAQMREGAHTIDDHLQALPVRANTC